jgi:ABC-2 type transport system permease protein
MTSRFPLFWLALRRRRRLLIALSLGMAAFEAVVVAIARSNPPQQLFGSEIQHAPGLFRALGGSGSVPITTYPGLLGFGLVHPFWIAMQLTAVASLAAAILAADVETGTIELIMVRPISRARLLAERVAALVAALVVVNVAAAGAVAVGVALTPPLRHAIPLAHVAAAGALGLALGLCIAGPAIAISAAGRRRAQVVAATVTFGAATYALNFVALAWSKAAALRYVTPFHYYTPADLLAHNRIPWSSFAVLLAVAIVGTATGAAALARRDLT